MPLPKVKRRARCPDCRRTFLGTFYITGPNGGVGGSTYCPGCKNERTKAWHRAPSGVKMECAGCGKWREVTNIQLHRIRIGAIKRPFCSVDCYRAWNTYLGPESRVHPPLAVHPTCMAPVPGGCPIPRETNDRGHAKSHLCDAHAKRRDRGARLDVPIRQRPKPSLTT